MANPFPFVANTVLTSAQLNGIGEAGTSFTPSVAAIVGTVTTASATGKYIKVNKLMYIYFTVTCTTAGSATVGFYVGIPSGFTTPITIGTTVGRNRENNITGAFNDNTIASTTLLSVFCTPANGAKFDGSVVIEVS